MDIDVMPGGCGDFVVWASDPACGSSTWPVRLARFDHADPAWLLCYAFADGPGWQQLLLFAPEVLASVDAHCEGAC